MQQTASSLFFDSDDYKLLDIVNDVLKRDFRVQYADSLMTPYMHPRGIKEMAAPSGLRIAYAIVSLLGSLETGKANDRITALRILRDEVFSSATSYYHKNTARVLMQIMKELVRSQDDPLRQLELAHDFHRVYTGKPLRVREELAKYHLLEMPEDWNQFAFDDRVHDANTKGRKSPTHLLMDAWIKGIRRLTVVYYNHVDEEVVEELLEAAAILDIHVRIGIEFSARFRNKFVRFLWELEGFFDRQSVLQFLREGPVQELMTLGRDVSCYQQRYVFEVLAAFNRTHRPALDQELETESQPLDEAAFLHFVGAGQPSLLHLTRYIYRTYADLLREEMQRAQDDISTADRRQREEALQAYTRKMAKLSQQDSIARLLQPSNNPELRNPAVPYDDSMPALLYLTPPELLTRLASMHSSSRFTLNLSNCTVQDALELLYDCQGKITHVEVFNLKDSVYGMTALASIRDSGFSGEAVDIVSPERNYRLIYELQKALNEDNVIALKRVIRTIIWNYEQARLAVEKRCEELDGQSDETALSARIREELTDMNERKDALLAILFDIASFHSLYGKRYLGSRIGSGSTGQTRLHHGMGLIVLDTLPKRALRQVVQKHTQGTPKLLPVSAGMIHHYHLRCNPKKTFPWYRRLVGAEQQSYRNGEHRWDTWSLDRFEVHPGFDGNVATLGGIRSETVADTRLPAKRTFNRKGPSHRYLNTHLCNVLKITVGFIPAFLTFFLTQDWWVLAYLGAFIWFGITGTRNIIQSILGGGGLRRSPLLPWDSLVSWSRVADSLFFTGFSVPLLDYLVKTVLLQQALGITTTTNPVALYSIIALANGVYISAHNVLRGLPRSAIIGNFFRSVLSIPLALLFNFGLASVLHLAMIPGVEEGLQKWAAIISKLASDCVAAVIEGFADRENNVRIRLADYHNKLSQLFSAYARLDVLFPDADALDLLQSPKSLISAIQKEAGDLTNVFMVNALDLMYIWLHQPRARKALQQIVVTMSAEEWLIFYRSQLILQRHREISQVIVDGLFGRNFAKTLAFYLDRSDVYLKDMLELGVFREKYLRKHRTVAMA